MTTETSNARGEWVLVPRVPTEAMAETFRADMPASTYYTHTTLQCADFASRYAAMLAAAPPPAAARGDVRGLVAKWQECGCGFSDPMGGYESCPECGEALAAEGVQAGEVEQRARELLEVLQAARNASAVLSHIYNTTPLGDIETDAFDAFQRLDTAMSAMRYEWFNVKNDCWTPIARLPREWERELGIQWRLAETGGNTNA